MILLCKTVKKCAIKINFIITVTLGWSKYSIFTVHNSALSDYGQNAVNFTTNSVQQMLLSWKITCKIVKLVINPLKWVPLFCITTYKQPKTSKN